MDAWVEQQRSITPRLCFFNSGSFTQISKNLANFHDLDDGLDATPAQGNRAQSDVALAADVFHLKKGKFSLFDRKPMLQ